MKKIYFLICFIFLTIELFGQNPTIDYKVHDAGAFRQVVTNTGALWRQQSRYPGLIYTEFPLGSNEEHLGEAGFAIAAIVNGDTLVTSSDSWDEPDEMFPTDADWDTIWTVGRNELVDIGDPADPYWQNYLGISDQDFVCKYSDDFWTKITRHRPMHIECIQRTMVWSFAPFNEFLILQFWITSKQDTLQQAYFGWFCDGNVGLRLEGWDFARDDFSWYDAGKDIASLKIIPAVSMAWLLARLPIKFTPRTMAMKYKLHFYGILTGVTKHLIMKSYIAGYRLEPLKKISAFQSAASSG